MATFKKYLKINAHTFMNDGIRTRMFFGWVYFYGNKEMAHQRLSVLDQTLHTKGMKEGNVLFNDTLNTFYLQKEMFYFTMHLI